MDIACAFLIVLYIYTVFLLSTGQAVDIFAIFLVSVKCLDYFRKNSTALVAATAPSAAAVTI